MKTNQEILVFPRVSLLTRERFVPWAEAGTILESVEEEMTWLLRNEAEQSADWMQPIPCAIIRNQIGEYHILRRVKQGRADLSSKLSLIVGGHIDRDPDNWRLPSLLSTTLDREIEEELGVSQSLKTKPIGLVIDHSSPFASRHVGFVHEVVIVDEFKSLAVEEFSTRSKYSGQSYSATGLSKFFKDNEFDPWSAIIFANYIAPSYSMDMGTQPEFLLALND